VVNSALLRKVVLGLGLLGAVYASFFMPEEVHSYQSAPVSEVQQRPLVSVTAPFVAGMPEDDADEPSKDPFAPRNWLPPAPPPEPVKSGPPSREVAAVVLPPGPPALPFKFAGRMNDGDDQVIYLARGETALIARQGDVLENTYKIVSINASQIELEHLPTGQKQALALPEQER
jgi:hypothetical protein